MKRIFYLLACLAAVALGSCTFADGFENETGGENGFSVVLNVEGMEANVTRGAEAIPEEKVVHSLTLLFFERTSDGSGAYLDFCTINNPVLGVAQKVVFRDGTPLRASNPYNILAVANLDQSRYAMLGSIQGVEMWCDSFLGKTENEVISDALANITGDLDGSRHDEVRIHPDKILMSATATKEAAQELVSMTLTRNVCRLDVVNKAAGYHLRSATIFNASKYSRVWSDDVSTAAVERFYGINAVQDGAGYKDILNELYCFENFVYKPSVTDKPDNNGPATTCLVIGVQKEGSPDITYHRVNIAPKDGLSQSLKRNMVYQVTVRGALGDGAPTPFGARNLGVNNLNYIINYWDLDDGDGIIRFDGKNVLAVPVSKIQFTSNAEEREYSIFTFGEGTLLMSVTGLDEGLTATLTGNTLKVSATALPEGVERNGGLKFTFAGMEAEIAINQTEKLDNFLQLSTYSLPVFPKTAESGLDNDRNLIKVDASGPWKAELRNNAASDTESKFSFSPSSLVETLDSDDALVTNNTVKLYTSSVNAAEYHREAFVLFKLKSDETVAQAAILTQKGNSDIVVSPQVDEVLFDPMAAAKTQTTFTVNPGETGGIYDTWSVDIVDGSDVSIAGEQFSIVNRSSSSTVLSNNKFTVIANKANFSGGVINARVKITSGASTYYIPIKQEAFVLEIEPDPSSTVYTVPVKGGNSEYIEIKVPEGMKWSAKITVNGTTGSENLVAGHKGYLVNPENGDHVSSLSGMDGTSMLRAYFPKLLTPNVNIMPEMKVTVTLEGSPLSKELTFQQEPLVPRQVKVKSYEETWGTLGIGSSNSTCPSYLDKMWYFIANRYKVNFGTSGTLKTAGAIQRAGTYLNTDSPRVIPSDITLFSASRLGTTDASDWTTTDVANVKKWWKETDGNTLLAWHDHDNTNGFTKFLNAEGYYKGPSSGSASGNMVFDSRKQTSKGMQYILNGPFGTVSNPSSLTFTGLDSTHSKLLYNGGFPDTAIPLISYGNTGTLVTIDFETQMFFCGEVVIFDDSSISGSASTPGPTSARGIYMANIVAAWINMSQYGSHWTDHFTGKATGGYANLTLGEVTP